VPARKVGRIQTRAAFGQLQRSRARASCGPVRATFVPVAPESPECIPSRVRNWEALRERGRPHSLRRRMRESARAIAPTLPRGTYLLRVEPAATRLGADAFVADVQRHSSVPRRRHGYSREQRERAEPAGAGRGAGDRGVPGSGVRRISPCRFYPSCSQYAVEAFTDHGFWRGFALTARRLVRCRPFGPHGVDLVPLPVHTREAPRMRRSQ